MTLFTSYYKSIVTALILLLNTVLQAQTNSINRTLADTASDQLNMDAVYNRPFLTFQKAPVALGGYLEANSIYSISDGVSEGLSFQARRLTIFMSSK